MMERVACEREPRPAFCTLWRQGVVKIVDLLQGKWLGHPLHPALVHLPVGLWPVACALDIALCAGVQIPGAGRLAVACVGLGLLAALGAVPAGIADWSSIKREKPAWKLGVIHMLLNVVAIVIWSINFGLRLRAPDASVSPSVLASSVAGTVLLLAGGYLGSLMTFDHGVGVARLSKKKWRQAAVRAGAHVPDEK